MILNLNVVSPIEMLTTETQVDLSLLRSYNFNFIFKKSKEKSRKQ